MTRFNKKECSRRFYDACAGDDIMSTMRHLDRSDWKRDNLMEAHLRLVYAYAHDENERIDWAVEHARSIKPTGIAARIVERQKAAA